MIPVPGSLVPILQFLNIRDVFSNKEKEPVAGFQFPVPEYQLHIDICSFHINLAVFILCRQITLTL